MCLTCSRPGRSLLTKRRLSAEEEAAIERFFSNYGGALDPLREDLVEAVEAGDITLQDPGIIEIFVEERMGDYSGDIDVVFRNGIEDGITVGRDLAANRHGLDVAFDIVPDRTLSELENWAFTASAEVQERLTGDIATFLYNMQLEGRSIPEIATALNDELFEGRLQTWEAKRIARTETIGSSNAGARTAYVDADSVVGQEWLTSMDGRQRDTHGAADGQIVPPGMTFLVGGYQARFPGDPRLPVKERVNERCATAPVFADQLSESQVATLQSGGRLGV